MEPSMEYNYFGGMEFATCLSRSFFVVAVFITWLASWIQWGYCHWCRSRRLLYPWTLASVLSLIITAFLALSVYGLILAEHVPITSLNLPVLRKLNLSTRILRTHLLWLYKSFVNNVVVCRGDLVIVVLLKWIYRQWSQNGVRKSNRHLWSKHSA